MSSSGTRGTGELVAEMDDAQMEEEEVSDNNVYDHDNHLFICKLKNQKKVTIQKRNEWSKTKFVSIRKFVFKHGVECPSNPGISLTVDQWSILKANMPAIEEAYIKLGGSQSELGGSQSETKRAKKEANIDLKTREIDCGSAKKEYAKMEGGVDKSVILSQMNRFEIDVILAGLNMDDVKRGLELMGKSERIALEERWNRFQIAEKKVMDRRQLISEKTGLQAFRKSNF